MVKFGFIGIGIMGRGMAMNLVKKGFDVTVAGPLTFCSLHLRHCTATRRSRTVGADRPLYVRTGLRTMQACLQWEMWLGRRALSCRGRGNSAPLFCACPARFASCGARVLMESSSWRAECGGLKAGLEPLSRQVQGPR